MTIHTTAPAEPTYVRIINTAKEGFNKQTPHTGSVGIVTSTGETPTVGQRNIKLVFVDIHGEPKALVFNEENVKYITKKEYFIGALGG